MEKLFEERFLNLKASFYLEKTFIEIFSGFLIRKSFETFVGLNFFIKIFE
jgi:hypothetical protein